MSVKIGHASISEKGTVNGAKGDQTGKEVCITTWYNKPWDYMAIHPDGNVRERHAKAIEVACANDYIGYGQGDRNTANTEAKKVGYDLSKIKTKCNTDCSALQNLAAVVAKTPGVSYGSNGWTTSTMKSALKSAGYKIIEDKAYLTSDSYCVRGAVYVKVGSHTVCALGNGSNAGKTLAKAGISGANNTPTVPQSQSGNIAYVGKGIGAAIALCSINVRSGPGVSNSSYGSISKGTVVEVLEIFSNEWYKIVWPGAACGYAYTSNLNGCYYKYEPKQSLKHVTVNGCSSLNIRKTPNGSAICSVKSGTSLLVIGSGRDSDGDVWTQVQYGNVVGYVWPKYIK